MTNIFTVLVLFVLINNLTAQTDKFSLQIDSASLKTYPVLSKTDDQIVFTPAGPALKSKVHLIDKEHFLNIEKTSIQIVSSKTGLISQQFDNVLIKNMHTNAKAAFFSGGKIKSVTDTILENGYVAYAEFSNSIPITYFSTSYIVPSPPVTVADQLIYLFNGLVWYEGGHILQPVLQWGKSPAGGGNFWAICNWYVINNDQYFHDTPIEVSPGTNLQGEMKITSRSGDSLFNYTSSFIGYPGSELQVNNIHQLNYAYEALEVYNIKRSTDYPTGNLIKMSDIKVETDPRSTVYWSAWSDVITDFGQHITIVNPNEVDIYFHSTPSHQDSSLAIDGGEKISLYPNPFEDCLHVYSKKSMANCKIEVYDVFGSLIETSENINIDTNTVLNINSQLYPKGIYLIKFFYEDKMITHKMIKK